MGRQRTAKRSVAVIAAGIACYRSPNKYATVDAVARAAEISAFPDVADAWILPSRTHGYAYVAWLPIDPRYQAKIHQEIAERIALRAVGEGHEYSWTYNCDGTFYVHNPKSDNTYRLWKDESGTWRCECPACYYQGTCKHIVAGLTFGVLDGDDEESQQGEEGK